MTKLPESPLKQELGPKKYYERVDKANRDYDKYKAGKTDPKTGVFYRPISFTNPNKGAVHGSNLGCYPCPKCSAALGLKSSTLIIQCRTCHTGIKVKFSRDDDSVELSILG